MLPARYDQLINNNPPYSSFYNSSSNEWTNIIWSGTVGNTNFPNDHVFFETGDLAANGVTYHSVYHNWFNPATNSYGRWVNEWEYWYILGIECPESGNWKTFLIRDYGSDYVQRMLSESNITLLSPQINEQLTGKDNIIFEWKGELPKDGFTLSIFEIDENQFKEIKSNKDAELRIDKPLFEETEIRENHFILSDSSVKFQAGRHYGWGVRVGISNSQPWIMPNFSVFQLNRPLHAVIWADNINDGVMNPADGEDNEVISWNNSFLLRWQLNSSFQGFTITDGDQFIVKIVKKPSFPVPHGIQRPDGTWYIPSPPTCSQLMQTEDAIRFGIQ
ncbi:MAG: hypothetical protein IPM38_14940 [Ignavibacteria bacterium]|nr:hypothetical protein [Ignavibacteria bacterium]